MSIISILQIAFVLLFIYNFSSTLQGKKTLFAILKTASVRTPEFSNLVEVESNRGF